MRLDHQRTAFQRLSGPAAELCELYLSLGLLIFVVKSLSFGYRKAFLTASELSRTACTPGSAASFQRSCTLYQSEQDRRALGSAARVCTVDVSLELQACHPLAAALGSATCH